jgi:translation elongation factor EF-G
VDITIPDPIQLCKTVYKKAPGKEKFMLILIKVLASPREFKKQLHLPMKNQFVYKYQTVSVAFEIAQ